MSMTSNSLAAGQGFGIKNEVFKTGAQVLGRKLLILATPLKANESGVSLNVPTPVISPEDVASRGGFGAMAHRLAIAAFRGSKAVTGPSTATGYLYLYVAGKLYQITVATGKTPTEIGDLIVSALSSDSECPVKAVNAAGVVTFTALSKGIWGNYLTIAVNQDLAADQALPSGVSVAITAMSGGSGVPDVATDIKTALGSGDSANEAFFTDVIHGYVQDSTVLDALSSYVGEGNEYVGLYDRNIHRPFRSLTGDVSTGSTGLSALLTLGAGRKQDRCNGVLPKPGSLTHPSEIAAEAMGYMAAANNERAEASYVGHVLSGVDPGLVARQAGNDWTTEYTNRDTAVKAGISATVVESGSVVLQNVITFYHPDSIPQKSNAFREMANVSKTQNILYNRALAYSTEYWQAFTVVNDKAKVTVAASRAKARDRNDAIATELSLIKSFMANGWLYDDQYSIDALKAADAVTVREGGDGFNVQVPYIYSGVGNIIDTEAYVDTSIAVVTQA
jgi:phage tail sheath gpL-like